MHLFDWFVVPFTLGLLAMLLILAIRYGRWIGELPWEDRGRLKKGILSVRSLRALKEVFMESLLHRKVFRVNPLLGYMHMSLAFGWFLLILIGNLESRIYYQGHLSPPYIPIFFRFFNPHPQQFRYENLFSLMMDALLLFVLSGVILAWIKRFYSRMFGLKRTSRLRLGDKLALSSLWVIFPLRFLAESFTSASQGGGHFLTATAGTFFSTFLPVRLLAYPAWWAYSLSLGCFFVALPFSRYMHIPTEVLLIFLRRYGITEKSIHTGYTRIEVNACSRCGICIDPCQLASPAKIDRVQSVYQLQSIRNHETCTETSLNCLMCGRCDVFCPVGIDIASIRLANRIQTTPQEETSFSYLPEMSFQNADVIFFAGCMTHLQPRIKRAMVDLLNASGSKYWFMDERESICCGRPLLLAGKKNQALELMSKNRQMIESSGASILVTACPICYNMFKNEYRLSVRVMHHSEYILHLLQRKKIELTRQHITAVYHDPCELGRKSGIYEQPRQLLSRLVLLQPVAAEKEKALCCGGSLANLTLSAEKRALVTGKALEMLMASHPDLLVTACPLCRQTFGQQAKIQVLDMAEVAAKSLVPKELYQREESLEQEATAATEATEMNV